MSAELLDSFDHYATANIAEKGWLGNGQIVTPGRTGAQAMQGGNAALAGAGSDYTLTSILFPSGNQPTIIVGLAFNNAGYYLSRFLFSLDYLGAPQIVVTITPDLSIQVGLPGGSGPGYLNSNYGITTLLGSTPNGVIAPSGWTHMELAVTAATTAAGSVAVRVNSIPQLTLTGVVTAYQSTALYAALSLKPLPLYPTIGAPLYLSVDDLYVNNGLGAAHNSFEGDLKIACYRPTGPGTYTQWTPLTGANYTQVNETLVDNDTSYVSTATASNKDSYVFDPITLPAGSTIADVQSIAIARKDDANARTISQLCKSGATEVEVSAQPVMTTYTCFRHIHETDPNTSAAWTPASSC